MADVDDPAPTTDRVPVTLESHGHVTGPFLHGTRAALAIGEELVAGHVSNFDRGRALHHVYFTTLTSTAAWGAELATALAGSSAADAARDQPHDQPGDQPGDHSGRPERGHIYVVEPLGPFEDDPNVTDQRFPGNPTESYRTRGPLRIVGELAHWVGHTPEQIQGMLESLARLRAEGRDVIWD